MSTAPTLARQINRAEVVDQQFVRFVQEYDGSVAPQAPGADQTLHLHSTLTAQAFERLFE